MKSQFITRKRLPVAKVEGAGRDLVPENTGQERTFGELRPAIIRQIARWWQQRLDAADTEAAVLVLPDDSEIMTKFQCSDEEALRGLSVGEQLHWGGR